MRIAVFGAGGATGQQIVRQALDGGREVAALVRRPDALRVSDDRLSVTHGDARDPAAVATVVEGADAAISAIALRKGVDTSLSDAMRSICQVMEQDGVRRLVVVSVLGLRDSAHQAGIFGRVVIPLLMNRAFLDKARVEEVVEASGLDYTLVRTARLVHGGPTGRYSARPDVRGKASSRLTRGDAADCVLAQAEVQQGEHSRTINVVGV